MARGLGDGGERDGTEGDGGMAETEAVWSQTEKRAGWNPGGVRGLMNAVLEVAGVVAVEEVAWDK